MRISLITNRMVPRDAVGRNHIYRASFLLRQGHEVHTYCNDYADIPPTLESCVSRVTLATLSRISQRSPSEPHLDHFTSSHMFIYDYSLYYDLMNSITWPKDGVTLFDYHGVTPPELWGTDRGIEPLRRGLEAVALVHYADYAVAHSEYAKEELISRTGLDQDRILQLGYPIHLGTFCPGPRDEDLAQFWGLKDGPVLLFVGRMAGNKRLDVLVKALRKVRESIPQARLLLVGDNTSSPYDLLSKQVRRLAEEYGLGRSVVFTGKVPDDILPHYYNLADVYVTSSLHECFCVPLVEAMACGKPVIGTDAAAIPCTIGDAGLTFAPGDAGELAAKIVQVLTSKQLYDRLSVKALERARMFSTERYEQDLDGILRQALGRDDPATESSGTRMVSVPLSSLERKLQRLSERAPLSMPYRVRSNKPLIGPLIARIRDELTVHLRLFYIDRITERQGLFNGLLVDALRAIVVRLDSLARRWDQMMAAAERQEQLETTLAQMREELSTLKREIEELKGTRQ